MFRNEVNIGNEGTEAVGEKTIPDTPCTKGPGFLSRFKDICKHRFGGLQIDLSTVFVYLIAIVAALAVIGFAYTIGKDDYETLVQPTGEIQPWIGLMATAIAIFIIVFGSYIIHQMTDGITRYTFMLSFLFIILLITIGFIALYMFASPSASQYIFLISIFIALWVAIFAATISYMAAGFYLIAVILIGLMFVIPTRIAAVN